MEDREKTGADNHIKCSPITSPEEMDKAIQEVEKNEQLYSIALFDILGFSNFVQNNGTQVVLDLYHKLIDLIHRMESSSTGGAAFSGSVVPVPVSSDWTANQLVADANGYIQVCISVIHLLFTQTSFSKGRLGGFGTPTLNRIHF